MIFQIYFQSIDLFPLKLALIYKTHFCLRTSFHINHKSNIYVHKVYNTYKLHSVNQIQLLENKNGSNIAMINETM